MAHKLLLADDSVTIQRVIELTFADEDVQVIVVGDGKQAIDRVQAERPDIVLADIGMPERDGYEVAAFIKGNPQLATIPVVLLTGAFEPIDETRARTVGCDAVLVKPFEPQMVITRVKELLARRSAARAGVAATAVSVPAASAGSARVRPSVEFDPDLTTAPAPIAPHLPVDFDSDLAPLSVPENHKAEGDSLEDYFDRLDAAFASMAAPPLAQPPAPPRAPVVERAEARPQTTVDVPANWEPEVATAVAPAPAPEPDLAHAFAALLAAEQGYPAPQTGVWARSPAAVSDDTIEEIVKRVLARMSDESMRRAVIDTAERVVREEIDRIKAASASRDPRSGG